MDPKASLSQQLLEQNEDLIAATVENLQLGRLDDCMQLYSILQKNLLVLSEELDNYPIDDSSNSSEMIRKFPDQIVRRDVLEEYMLQGAKESSTMPIPAACQACAEQGVSPY